MSGMDQFLAEYYGTNGASQSTETIIDKEAEASFDLFAKVAAAEGIDLSKMSDEDVMALYTKVAGEDEHEDKEEERKKEKEEEKKKEAAAKAELAAKTAAASTQAPTAEAQEKLAEADFLGRVMAHAYVQEMKKIAEASTEVAPEATKEAARPFSFGGLEKQKSFADKLKGFAGKAREHGGAAVEKVKEHAGKAHEKGKEMASKIKEHAEKHPKTTSGATHGAAAAAAGGAGFMAGHKEKKGSALDELAAERAMAKIAEANWDTDQGAELLSTLVTAGASEENTKIAAANGDLEQALEIRSLELLEQCGYTVNWA